ncbi:MAG: hypothetical protein NVV74_22980 [Magnetospirillum sp.]|nr:hypothetical protein [Magnetospirillum sp.]
MTMRILVLSAALLVPLAAQAGSVMQGTTAKGPVLTDEKGMTLYTFDKDEAGKIACVDACAQNWPPLLADKGAKAMGEYSLVKRPDGAMQWAYRGKPLYLWSKDMKPGDISGDGFKDIWHAARP